MKNLESNIKVTKPVVVDSYSNWSIPSTPTETILQEVKENNDNKATVIKMAFDSQYRLLKFLMRVI